MFSFAHAVPNTKDQNDAPVLDTLALREKQQQNKDIQAQLATETEAYIQTLLSLLALLAEMLEDVRHTHHAQHHAVFVDYFSAVVKNIYRKLKCLELDLLHQLYESEFGKTLRDEMSRLIDIQNETNHQIALLDQKLAVYQGAGPEFDDILKLYLRISKDVSNLEMDLVKMNR
ncbi:hypothetical protein HDU98_006925 [Podochytrium sp. JEL0797]|nr:hypothetical protein HDU98_006925 [Podochytrium sp. JEL0797]